MKIRTAALTITALLALGLPALAQTKAPGVTDTEVVVGITTPLSGPAATWGATALGMEAWAKHVNEQGGVNGRKIRVVIKDDGYNPGRALANLNEIRDSVFMNVGLLGSAILNAAKDFPAANKFPVVNPYGNPTIWAAQPKEKLRYVFVNYPDYRDETDFLVTYAANNLGVKKFGIFYQNDAFGLPSLEGAKRAMAKLGGKATLVGQVPYEVADRELGTHALKLKESGAEGVVIFSTTVHGANIVKEMAKVGFRPKLLGSFPVGDHITMFRLTGQAWEGAYFNVLGTPLGEPASDRVVDIITKIDPKLKANPGTALAGVAPMMLAVEGLKRAGRNLTRESFVEAMESIKDFTSEGLTGPITFGPNRRHGLNSVRLMKAENAAQNKISPVTGYQTFPPLF